MAALRIASARSVMDSRAQLNASPWLRAARNEPSRARSETIVTIAVRSAFSDCSEIPTAVSYTWSVEKGRWASAYSRKRLSAADGLRVGGVG